MLRGSSQFGSSGQHWGPRFSSSKEYGYGGRHVCQDEGFARKLR